MEPIKGYSPIMVKEEVKAEEVELVIIHLSNLRSPKLVILFKFFSSFALLLHPQKL